MQKKINTQSVFNIPIANVTFDETLTYIDSFIKEGKQLHHTVVNAGKIVLMQSNTELAKSVLEADLINADGQAVVWASKILGKPLKERVAGIDLMNRLFAFAHEKGYKVYLFGATEDVVSSVKNSLEDTYSEDIIAGYRNGYYTKEEEPKIAEEIAASGANLLFVAISSPTKENFLFKYKEVLKDVNFIMGVGGSFDVVAGKVKRAPVWMQNSGLEWLYRVIQEPRRMWKRYLVGNVKFLLLVLKEKFKK